MFLKILRSFLGCADILMILLKLLFKNLKALQLFKQYEKIFTLRIILAFKNNEIENQDINNKNDTLKNILSNHSSKGHVCALHKIS